MSFWQSTNNIVECNTWLKRLRGLYFREANSVCFIYPCNCIHTFFFTKNIDVAFVNKSKEVINVIKNLQPWRIRKCKNSFCVIERFSNNNDFLNIGDNVNFERRNYESLSNM